jgi:U32 family peptidase
MKKPELLAPAGSFMAAFHAFEAGADGVYLGMQEFSARASAQNFTLVQLRRVRQLAADRGRRMYVTINTVVREEEIPRLREALAWLEALRVDGVILQDLGVVDMVLNDYPGLTVHASTQMGVHNDSGLAIAEGLGIRRAILSRELPFERIRGLRARHPGIELEVFVHGALCYSFSGACLASWSITGRSGNRGECAQVCRSVFSADEEAGGFEASHLFSTRDLFLGRDVLKLAGIGIDALKIEGRMKSPEYVFNVTRLYREVLDRGEGIPAEEYGELVRRAELGFSRTTTSGWFDSEHGARLLEPGVQGHRGAFMGKVEGVQGRQMELRLEGDLSLHDGLAFHDEVGKELAAFPVLKILRSGREVKFANKGDTVSVEVPRGATPVMPRLGQEIRQLSSRFLDLPQPRESSFPMYKIPLDILVTFGSGGLLSFQSPGFPEFARNVAISPATVKKPFLPILTALLEESGESAFRPGVLSFINETGLPGDGIFVRPSELKRVKNELYQFLEQAFPSRAISKMGTDDLLESSRSGAALGPAELALLAHREMIVPPGMSPIPFAGGDPAALGLSQLAECAGFHWLPLPPVLLDEAPWIEAVQRLTERHPGTRLAIGLNNMSHLAFAAALSDRPNAWFFADFFLYAANDRTVSFLRARIPRFLFAYGWLEQERAVKDRPASTVQMSADFSPPLFYSLGCFARHTLTGGQCRDDCPKDFGGELRQGRNRFRLLVRDCVTYLFRAGSPAG